MVPPTEPCALRSTQPLKVSTRDFSWGKGSRCIWLTTYHPCSAETARKSRALTYPELLGPPRPVAGHLYYESTRILIQYKPTKCTFRKLIFSFLIFLCLLHVSNMRVQLQEYIYSYGMVRFTCINISSLVDRRILYS